MYWKSDVQLYPGYLKNRIRRGRGVGEHSNYVPWLKVRDVPSRGTSSVVLGIKTTRPHHMLSSLEATYFYLIERKPSTIDIREQFPILDIASTLEYCSKYGVRHGYKKSWPEPFTIDFLITERTNAGPVFRAASIKTPEDAANPDVLKRLRIEHDWCQKNNIKWKLVDTDAFNKTLLATLRFLRSWFRHKHAPEDAISQRFADQFGLVYVRNEPLGELICSTAKRLRIPQDLADDLFRYCGWTERISVSLQSPIAMDSPLILRRNRRNG